MAALNLVVPLAGYEKLLIDNFTDLFSWTHGNSGTNDDILAITRYKWSKRFSEALGEVISDSEWCGYHKGDWETIVVCMERSLQMEIRDDKLRFKGLMTANRHLPQISFSPDLQITVKALSEDHAYWATLSSLLRFYDSSEPLITESPSELEGEPAQIDLGEDIREIDRRKPQMEEDIPAGVEVVESTNTKEEYLERVKGLWGYHSQQRGFEVWSLLRACASILRRDTESIANANEAIMKTGFYELHDAVHNGFVRNKISRPGKELSESGPLVVTALGLQMVTFDDHPLKYIEFIPWKQLEPFHPKEPLDYVQNRGLMLWKSAKLLAWEKHLYTEDGIFGTCVLSGFPFPEYRFEDSIIFAISPISAFELETGSFWKRWNDCSVTKDPETGAWHLLETLPGIRFRSISNTVDEAAAVQFFRGLVENKIQGRTESVADVLGIHFQPKYENLLALIPHSQISKIDPVPLGEGERGVVYRAVWSHQAGFGGDTLVHNDVALKSIKIQGNSDLQSFIKELDSTFSAVSGGATASIRRLRGILKMPCYRDLNGSSPCFALPENRLFLVLDYAIHGGLKQYLLKNLKGVKDDWPILVGFMGDIINGLTRIHERNLVHRDIHWGNVLVSIRYCTGDIGPVGESIEAVISDLGEGQQISTQSHGRTYYGNEAFWAPEIRKGQHHTPASDIYAVGCLFLEMVQLHWDRVQPEEPGSTAREIQRGLLAIIMACLETNAEDRPTARELSYELDDIEYSSKDDKEQEQENAEVLRIEPERLQVLLWERCNPKEEQKEEEGDIVL